MRVRRFEVPKCFSGQKKKEGELQENGNVKCSKHGQRGAHGGRNSANIVFHWSGKKVDMGKGKGRGGTFQ